MTEHSEQLDERTERVKKVTVPTDREMRKHVRWLFSLDGDALIKLAAIHYVMAAQAFEKEYGK